MLRRYEVIPLQRDREHDRRDGEENPHRLALVLRLDEWHHPDLAGVADLGEDEIRTLELVMGRYMQFRLSELSGKGNDELLKECRDKFGDQSMDDTGAASLILKEIWRQIKETHKLRILK